MCDKTEPRQGLKKKINNRNYLNVNRETRTHKERGREREAQQIFGYALVTEETGILNC